MTLNSAADYLMYAYNKLSMRARAGSSRGAIVNYHQGNYCQLLNYERQDEYKLI